MKLPKKVQICGKVFTVAKDKSLYDSSGLTLEQTITVGAKSNHSERLFENFLHEVMELIACERNVRYGSGVSDQSMFVMSHKEFDNFCVDVATSLRPMIKE